jgi:hypothetical protein
MTDKEYVLLIIAANSVVIVAIIHQLLRWRRAMTAHREAIDRLNAQTLVQMNDPDLSGESYRNWRKGTILCQPQKL